MIILDIFCKIINGEIPCKKIFEDELVMVIMDVNPRSPGHVLVIPKKHYQDLFDIDMHTLTHIMEISKKVGELLIEKLDCKGITLENNTGIVQEVKHFHLHIIPKYDEKKNDDIESIFNKLVNN